MFGQSTELHGYVYEHIWALKQNNYYVFLMCISALLNMGMAHVYHLVPDDEVRRGKYVVYKKLKNK